MADVSTSASVNILVVESAEAGLSDSPVDVLDNVAIAEIVAGGIAILPSVSDNALLSESAQSELIGGGDIDHAFWTIMTLEEST